MSHSLLRKSTLSLAVGAVIGLGASPLSAEILAYKQLSRMYQQGDGSWNLTFVERLANTGDEVETGVQIITDLSPLGAFNEMEISPVGFVSSSNGEKIVTPLGIASSNNSFNGESEKALLAEGASLGPDEILVVSYSVSAVLPDGPIAVSSIVGESGDESANGERPIGDAPNANLDQDFATLISLPLTTSTPVGCVELESTFNLVKNGDFQTVHGEKPSGSIPLQIESNKNGLLAGSFYSDSFYAGDDSFPANNNDSKFYGEDAVYLNGISIQQTGVGSGITLHNNTFFQHAFPGDPTTGEADSNNFLLYHGNSDNQRVDVWKQQISRLTEGESYRMQVYVSNAAWPGSKEVFDDLIDPSVTLSMRRADGSSAVDVFKGEVTQETSNERDTWVLLDDTFTAPATEIELAVIDEQFGQKFGDRLAIANIGLYQCVPAVGDTDGDGVSNQDEVAAGTDPGFNDTDGDGVTDDKEINGDEDKDGISDALESSKEDSDGDGVFDQFDDTDGNLDSDGDGLSDEIEKEIGSNPFNSDSDGDGVLDGDEFGEGTKALDEDKDGIPDILEAVNADKDNDGVFDQYDPESVNTTGKSSGGASHPLMLLGLAGFAAIRRRLFKA